MAAGLAAISSSTSLDAAAGQALSNYLGLGGEVAQRGNRNALRSGLTQDGSQGLEQTIVSFVEAVNVRNIDAIDKMSLEEIPQNFMKTKGKFAI